jgi:hypothetical protein
MVCTPYIARAVEIYKKILILNKIVSGLGIVVEGLWGLGD